MSDFNYELHPPRPHGSEASYDRGCHCGDCRAAHAAYARRVTTSEFAKHPDLAEFMRTLGWDKPIPRYIPAVFVERWNREHPERPYIHGA